MNKGAKAKGFTLVEGLIVLGVVAVIAAMTASFLADQATDTLHDATIAAEAKDMALLSRAADDYTRAHDDLFPVGTTKPIAVTDLINEHLLPDGFANRNGAVGTSPLYQSYTVVAQRVVAGEPVRIVVSDGPDSNSPAPPVGRLSRIGVPYTTQAIHALNQAIAEKIQREYRVVAATLPPAGSGWATVDGVAGAFTKDLTGLLHALSWPRTVTLINFPDLSFGGGDDGGGNTHTGKYQSCRVAHPSAEDSNWDGNEDTIIPATCPAGYVNAGTWPHCNEPSNANVIWNTDVGSITLGKQYKTSLSRIRVVDRDHACDPRTPGCTPGGQQTMFDYFTNTVTNYGIVLNGAQIATDVGCTYDSYWQGSKATSSSACSLSYGGAIPCAYHGREHDPVVNLGGSDDIMCCLPK
jgi:type II secretory pathway pseudopilin PulG